MPAVINGALVMGAAVGAMLVRKHVDRKKRTDDPDSMEYALGQRARADAFGYALAVLGLLGFYMFLSHQIVNGLAVYALMGVAVGAYWIRFMVLRAKMG